METAVQAGIKKLVFSSTAAVYQSSETPLTEDSPLGPTNVYGHTKLMTEQALEWYRSIYGLHFAALRYFNASGALPGRGEAHQPESHLIPRVLQIALGQAESATIFGTDYPTADGTGVRDYIHVEDLASAHLAALHYLRAGGESVTLNAGYGHGYSVREVLSAMSRALGSAVPFVEQPRRAGDPPELVAECSRIQQVLGWKPALDDLDLICASALQWERTLLARRGA